MAAPQGPNIWQALAISQVVQGGIPYIDSTNNPVVDVLNLYWNSTTRRLYLGTNGDNTGTDGLNTYLHQNSYLAASATVSPAVNSDSQSTAGHTVKSSQGTGAVPTYSLSGDFLGQFSGWSYNENGVVNQYAYRKAGGISFYTSGTHGNALGMGGEMRFATKIDLGAVTEWIKLDSAGAFMPIAASTPAAPLVPTVTRLGKAGFGWGAFTLDYSNSATIGAVTVNKPCGRVNIAAAATSVVVTNSLVTAASKIFATIAQADATALLKNIVPAAGSFTINLNAAATANCAVDFFVVQTDS